MLKQRMRVERTGNETLLEEEMKDAGNRELGGGDGGDEGGRQQGTKMVVEEMREEGGEGLGGGEMWLGSGR